MASQRFLVRQDEQTTVVEVSAGGQVRVGAQGEAYLVTPAGPGEYLVSSAGRTWRVAVVGPPDARWVWCEGASACLDVRPDGRALAPSRRLPHGVLSAPMPGRVIGVEVEAGQQVRAGDVLLTLEAMKMELPIRAPKDGIVSAVRCVPGELVQPGPPLVEIT